MCRPSTLLHHRIFDVLIPFCQAEILESCFCNYDTICGFASGMDNPSMLYMGMQGADTEQEEGEYRDMVPNDYDIQAAERSVEDDTALRQVLACPPRLSESPCLAERA